jgi:hypothetical protein
MVRTFFSFLFVLSTKSKRKHVVFLSSRLVTFEWLKSSSKIGEWLNGNSYEPRRLFQSIPSLNFYRKSRQQNQPIELFHQSGRIYLTSLVKQRSNLLKLILLLGGNVFVFLCLNLSKFVFIVSF